jgi:DNA-binding transcriptional LysR family regulator
VRSFLAVLDAGSLMGAARRLGAQQPTLSRHIAELEAQLGAPLFERTGRGVTPTAAALAIADAARQMEAGAEQLARSWPASATPPPARCASPPARWRPATCCRRCWPQLQQAEPGIQIELVASNQLSNLLRREADIALRMVRPAQSSLVARKLADLPIVASRAPATCSAPARRACRRTCCSTADRL